MSKKELISQNNLPEHVAIIMDGNGRWAQHRGEHRMMGHAMGVESVREVVKAAGEIGVKYLTLYAFSTENWNRPQEEVNSLMELLVNTITAEIASLHENGVKVDVIGDFSSLPESCQKALNEGIELTRGNKRVNMILALSYSARWEILNAVNHIVRDTTQKKLAFGEINEDIFSSYLTTAGIPDPALLIRTSGEARISNFLLWQLAYAELYFTAKLWPDFKKEDFFEAILDYQKRERRFGKTSAQITNNE